MKGQYFRGLSLMHLGHAQGNFWNAGGNTQMKEFLLIIQCILDLNSSRLIATPFYSEIMSPTDRENSQGHLDQFHTT